MSIASEITRLQQAKADIKTAIEGKGVTVPSSATLDDYADLVDSISGGGGGNWEQQWLNYTTNTYADYVLPDGTTTLRSEMFRSWGIRNLTIPSTVTTVGRYSFARIGSSTYPLEKINWLAANPTMADINSYIYQYTYFGNGDLDNFLPSGCTFIGAHWFNTAYFDNNLVIVPARINNIKSSNTNFNNITEIEFRSTTPPTLSYASLGGSSATYPIYVPDSAVETYKGATNWISLASRIKKISERPTT